MDIYQNPADALIEKPGELANKNITHLPHTIPLLNTPDITEMAPKIFPPAFSIFRDGLDQTFCL